MPFFYTIEGDKSAVTKSLVVSPSPDQTYTAKLLYFGNATLTDDVSTNTILTNHSDLYLYGSLFHLFNILQDYQAAGYVYLIYEKIIKEIDIDDNQERFGTQPLVAKAAYREAPYRSFT